MPPVRSLGARLLLACVLATGAAGGQEGSPARTSDPARDLAWPEVTNATALIELARTETEEDLAEGIHGKVMNRVVDSRLEYLRPMLTWAAEDYIIVILDTHPFTGQALVVGPTPAAVGDLAEQFAWVGGTGVPEIKRVLLKLSGDTFRLRGSLDSLDDVLVLWRRLVNLAPDRTTCPYPTKVFAPGYPEDMAYAAINGKAELEFVVTKDGQVTDVTVTATHREFAGPAVEAIKLWRFEPGVDLVTRLPVACRVSLTLVYHATGGSYK